MKYLEGILPVCSSCKKIRDEHGQWHTMESYIHDKSAAKFSHGICPECTKRLYPDYYKDKI
jgi:two-component system response regulator VanR